MHRVTRLALLVLVAALLLPPPQPAPAQSSGVSDARFARLARGINVPFWFWLGPQHLNDVFTRLNPSDFELIRDLGFTYVRVPVALDVVLDEDDPDLLDDDWLLALDWAIETLVSYDLAVMVDLHSTAPTSTGGTVYSGRLEDDPAFVETFIAFWRNFAAHLRTTNPEMVFLEPMNEPVFEDDPSRWPPIQAELLAAIRAEAPDHTLIATSARWSNVETFVELEPLVDPNIVYNFHFYEPFYFTHQGASWAGEMVANMRLVPYPSSPEAIAMALDMVCDEQAQQAIRGYGQERWDAAKLDDLIGQAAAWGAQHNVRLICNEFGVYKPFAMQDDRWQWFADVITLLEGYGIGWAMWEYDDSFGLVERRGDRVQLDTDLAAALGLQPVDN
jgi:endoglucanase